MQPHLTDDDLPLQRLYRWERETAGRIFLTQPYGGGKVRDWSWAQAAGEVRRVAAHLRQQNWEPGTRVAILSKNCAWWIMADLAIWMTGHVTVPVYPSLKPHTVRKILEHSECRGCFFGATDDPEVPRMGIPSGVYRIALPPASEPGDASWEDVVRDTPPIEASPTRPADDLATIIYTSGTTGAPKGVMHRFAALSSDALSLRCTVDATCADRFVSYLPLAHIVERSGLEVTSLLLGSRIFFVETINTFLDDLKRAKATIFLSVPRLLLKFQQGVFQRIPKEKLEKRLHMPLIGHVVKRKVLSALGLNTVRLAASGAAPLPTDVLLWYRNLGLGLAEGYGMTETLITHLPKPDQVRPGCVGPPLAGVETRLTETGELLVKSPMNMIGYYKEPEATRTAFDDDGFFRTGDLASMDADGQMRIIGRVKEQFKTSKGKYVAPAPIESRLSEHPAVDSCCLMGAGLPSPFALVLLTPEARAQCGDPNGRRTLEASLEEQLASVNAGLESHERLAFLTVVEGPWTIENELITPTLKIRRSKLEQQYLGRIDDWRSRNRPVVWDADPRQ
ncbi:MAG TPA: AMP-binding protein [Verrucomicrobiae bacterium]|nr:AMP-binding protein [Verrucomicrobiae bacterium]